MVSGTTDNSILTNYAYIQRTPKYVYKIKSSKDGPVQIEENVVSDDDGEQEKPDDDDDDKAPSILSKGSHVSRSAKNVLGYDPIKTDILFQCADNARKWLNYHVLNTKITDFPRSIIEDHGKQLWEFVKFFTGK